MEKNLINIAASVCKAVHDDFFVHFGEIKRSEKLLTEIVTIGKIAFDLQIENNDSDNDCFVRLIFPIWLDSTDLELRAELYELGEYTKGKYVVRYHHAMLETSFLYFDQIQYAQTLKKIIINLVFEAIYSHKKLLELSERFYIEPEKETACASDYVVGMFDDYSSKSNNLEVMV